MERNNSSISLCLQVSFYEEQKEGRGRGGNEKGAREAFAICDHFENESESELNMTGEWGRETEIQ